MAATQHSPTSRAPGRFGRLIEQPLFLFSAGALLGVMGVFFVTPVLVVSGLCLLLAVRQSNAISDRPVLPDQLSAYVSLGVLIVGGLSWLNTAIENRLANISSEPSVLIVSALATNFTFPGTQFAGIDWKDGYGDLRVSIENPNEPSIQNVDLNVQIDHTVVIWEIGQLSDVPGVDFHVPDDVLPDVSARLKGSEGRTTILTFRDMMNWDGVKGLPNRWKVFIPRLPGSQQLRLVLATSADKVKGTLATKVRVFGNYQLAPSEGGKIVKVDTAVEVERSRPK